MIKVKGEIKRILINIVSEEELVFRGVVYLAFFLLFGFFFLDYKVLEVSYYFLFYRVYMGINET